MTSSINGRSANNLGVFICSQLAVLSLLFGMVSTGFAETPDESAPNDPTPLATDRPGFGNGPVAVPSGSLQAELGAEAMGVDSAVQLDTLSTLARFGVTDIFELRLESQLLSTLWIEDTSESTALPFVGIGSKIGGQVSDNWSAAIVPSISTPRNNALDTVTADAMGTVSYGGLPVVTLDLNAGASKQFGDVSGPTSYSGGLAAATGFSEDLSGFIQVFGSHNGSTDLSFNGGGTYLLTSLLQLDAYAGVGLTEPRQIFGGLGLSFRVD